MKPRPQPQPPRQPLPFPLPLSPEQRQQLHDQTLDQMLIQTHQLQTDLASQTDSSFSVAQRINALKAVATIIAVYSKLRAAAKDAHEPGSAVRTYTQAFSSASGVSRRESDAGSDDELEAQLAELDRDDSEGDDAAPN